ncbi:MAG TPA: hypothetical protein VM869_00445, partial [Enhygromyxa sp.]|nr:hypothetical protein [Enhygromyxa sp.]
MQTPQMGDSRTGKTRSNVRILPAETSGSVTSRHPPKPAGAQKTTRRNQRAQPAETSGSLKDKEDPILTVSYPVVNTTTQSNTRMAQQILIPVEVEPPNPVDELLDLHERLSIEAYAAHGRRGKGGRVVGKLPRRSSSIGKR